MSPSLKLGELNLDVNDLALILARTVYTKVPIVVATVTGVQTQCDAAIAEEHLFNNKLNIFALDKDIIDCARALPDRDVRSRGIHYAQILSNVHHHYRHTCGRDVLGDVMPAYRRWGYRALLPATYSDHPSVKWAGNSVENYQWLSGVLTETWREYKYRFGREHRLWPMLNAISAFPIGLPSQPGTPPPQTLREEYRIATNIAHYHSWQNVVDSYRLYFIEERRGLTWTKRESPAWYVRGRVEFVSEVEIANETVVEWKVGKKFKI